VIIDAIVWTDELQDWIAADVEMTSNLSWNLQLRRVSNVRERTD